MRGSNPAIAGQVTLIEGFLSQLEQFILFPRIVEVPKVVEKRVEVEKDKIVALPKDDRSVKMELSLSLLVEKLILELKRIKKQNPNLNLELEEDVRLLFFSELDAPVAGMDTDLSHKLRTFSESVNRKFESLGPWTKDHQLMLNSFLQERFLMANVVKSANSEIEKSKTSGIKTVESLKRSEAEIEAYKSLFGKLRSSMGAVEGFEVNSILQTIFTEFDKVTAGKELVVKDLGNLAVTDARISSLIREKDAELLRLRDELTRLNKLKSTVNNEAAHNRTISVLTDENNKLKNEINALKADRGSAELMGSYKQQIQALNRRITELEQEKSDLAAQVLNLENELKVRLSVQNFNTSVDIKRSTATHYNDSNLKRETKSPIHQVGNLGSPKEEDLEVRMVTSQIEGSGSANRSATYGLTESQRSGSSREPSSTYGTSVQNVTSAYQTPASSSVSGDSSVSGSAIQTTSTVYQPGTTTTTQRTTYQTGQTGPTYQTSGSSQLYQSGSYQGSTYQPGASGNSGVYQSGASGNLGASGTGTSSYQSSSYQPYQGSYNYQSSTYRSGSSGSGVRQPQQGSSSSSSTTQQQGGSTQGNTYRYGDKR